MRKGRLVAVVAGLALLLLLLGWSIREATTDEPATSAEAGATKPAPEPASARRAASRPRKAAEKTASPVEPGESSDDASSKARAVADEDLDAWHDLILRNTKLAEPTPVREARGVVVDAATQKPVAGARVLLAVLDGPKVGSWYESTTTADGWFQPFSRDAALRDARFELRVAKDGYEPVRVPAADGEMRVELRPRTTPVLPGRVVGVARGADGRALAGEIAVESFDDQDVPATQHVVADANGAFVLEGVPPGRRRLRIERGPFVEANVPEDGEARVELAAPKEAERSSFVVTDIDPEAACSDDAKVNERLDPLRDRYRGILRDPRLDATAREKAVRDVAQQMQRLLADAAFGLPRRDVVVTGLPTEGRAWLGLERRPFGFRRVEATDGVARFASVPTDAYSAVLAVPGRPERSWPLVVPAGDGAFETSAR